MICLCLDLSLCPWICLSGDKEMIMSIYSTVVVLQSPNWQQCKIFWCPIVVCVLVVFVYHFTTLSYDFLFCLKFLSWNICNARLYYSHITQTDGRWAKNGKIGRRRPRFWKIFWSADDFFVEAPKLKVSLTDPPIFRGFVIGEASGDGRPMIGRQSADNRPTFWRFFHHDIGRRSPDHRASIGRRLPDGRSMTIYQRTVDRQTPDIGRHTADNRPTVGRS